MHSFDKLQMPINRALRSPCAHVGDMIFRERQVLGSGYSGEVKKVEDENGHTYALKVSNDKTIRFVLNELPSGMNRMSLVLPEASEFDRLRRLYHAGVPVPRPYGFQIYANADGVGTTALLMDLVKGSTLRDWLSEQMGGVPDKLSGRSMHPALTYADAVARVDVAVAVVEGLLKLRPLGFFADFKPRNVMIKEQRIDKSRYFNASLVDIGGVVLYQDASTNSLYRRPESPNEDQSLLFFHPIKDRYLIETTCSYLSPEMALLIAEYDYWRGRLHNHYFATQLESLVTADERLQAEKVYVESQRRCGRTVRADQVDLRVVHNYLNARKKFSNMGALARFFSIPQLNGGGNAASVTSASSEPTGLVPYHSDIVVVSEKSTVYTMGLVLTELFGGKRTGLTALTRLRAVNEIFTADHHNAEFRIAMEWETRNPLLNAYIHNSSAASTRCPNSNDAGVTKSNETVKNSSNEPGKAAGGATDRADSLNENADQQSPPAIPMDCYFDLYRRYAYPSEGFLRVPDVHDPSVSLPDPECAVAVVNILDSCLRINPADRPTLNGLMNNLKELRRHICAVNVQSQQQIPLQIKHTPPRSVPGSAIHRLSR